jgi:hypothetical protein
MPVNAPANIGNRIAFFEKDSGCPEILNINVATIATTKDVPAININAIVGLNLSAASFVKKL